MNANNQLIFTQERFLTANLLLPMLYHAGWEIRDGHWSYPQREMSSGLFQARYVSELACYVRTIPYHWLMMVLQGEVVVTCSDFRTTIGENAVVHFQPHQPHHISADQPANYIWIHYKMLLPSQEEPLLPLYPDEQVARYGRETVFQEAVVDLPSIIVPRNPNLVRKLFTTTVEEFMLEPPGFMLSSKANFQCLLTALFREATDRSSPAIVSDPAIQRALDHIHQHYDTKMTISSLAALVNLSQNYFISRFGKIVGISPNEYILRFRIRHAKMLLRDTDMRLTEIAACVGFESLSYFSRMFRKLEGIPPSEYKSYKLRTDVHHSE
ncbi:AraC family transcriptional regulator [Paenibacillus agaridevorans]|nr:AraC family transcriptional regulator [Paenibacillus agaridevorans]